MSPYAKIAKLTSGRMIILAGLCASLLIGAIVIYIVRLNRTIAGERERQSAASRVEVEEQALRAPSTDGLTLYLNASDVRAVATFAGVRYLATSGGLIALDEGGNVARRFTTLDGLPDNDLTALAVFVIVCLPERLPPGWLPSTVTRLSDIAS